MIVPAGDPHVQRLVDHRKVQMVQTVQMQCILVVQQVQILQSFEDLPIIIDNSPADIHPKPLDPLVGGRSSLNEGSSPFSYNT